MIDPDPWGGDDLAANRGHEIAPLPPRLAGFASLTGRLNLDEAEEFRFPDAGELPEVAALVKAGWLALDDAPLFACLPAVWPAGYRCWVPDRRPRVLHRFDGQRHWFEPWSPQEYEMTRQERADAAAECGLPPPPTGRIWLLRSPWPTIDAAVVLHLIGLHADEVDPMVLTESYTRAGRELLGWDEEQVWSWWPGPTGHAARAWRRKGEVGGTVASVVLAGLDPDTVTALVATGLTRATAVAWAEALQVTGVDAVEQVPRWLALGLPADPPPQLTEITTHLTPEQVAVWLAAGFDLAEISRLVGADVATATLWRTAGLSVRQTCQILDADPTLTGAELRDFDANGIGWDDALVWIAHGFDAASANQWRRLDVTPMLARVWRSVGLTALDALARTDPGADVEVPPGVEVGWFAPGPDPRQRHYGVVDPPGTRGSVAREHSTRGR